MKWYCVPTTVINIPVIASVNLSASSISLFLDAVISKMQYFAQHRATSADLSLKKCSNNKGRYFIIM